MSEQKSNVLDVREIEKLRSRLKEASWLLEQTAFFIGPSETHPTVAGSFVARRDAWLKEPCWKLAEPVEQTEDLTQWRYPEFASANRTIHIRQLEGEISRLVAELKASFEFSPKP